MESVLDDIFFVEIKKKEDLLKQLQKYLNELPKGTLFFKQSKKSVYVYRKWKESGKTVSKYIGKLGTQNTMIEIQKVNEYKSTLKELKKIEKEIKEYKKAYRLLLTKTKIN